MKNKKQLSYEDFWRSKGEYGKERVRRFLLRKEIRSRKNSCPRCHNNPKENLHSCPYNIEMYRDYECRCRCCNHCEHNCAMDI